MFLSAVLAARPLDGGVTPWPHEREEDGMHASDDPARLLLPRLLLVEDDAELGAMVAEMLGTEYRVDLARTMGQAEATMASRLPDVLVVDRRLPDGDGLELVRRLRLGGVVTPAIMLTARAQVDDVVEGLDRGANDYMTKPFHIEELRARLRAMLRGFRTQSRVVAVGDWTLKPALCAIEDPQGRRVPLTEAQVRLLETLATAPDHVFTRDELIGGVFSPGSDPGVVDVYVSNVRRLTVRAIIETVRGRGYRIGAPEEP